MEKILINTPDCQIRNTCWENWESVKEMFPEKGVVIITDDNVKQIYGNRFPEVPVFSVTPGEESKKLEVIEYLAEKLLEEELTGQDLYWQ